MRGPCRPRSTIVAVLSSVLLTLIVSAPVRSYAAPVKGGVFWPILLDSNFAANAPAGWPLGTSISYSETIGDGRYAVSVPEGQTHEVTARGAPAVSDGYIRAVVRLTGRGQVGVSVRMNTIATTGYTFWIDQQGRCGGERQVDSGTTTALFGVYSPAILPTGDNVLTLEIAHGRLTFAVNGQTVYDAVDPQPLPIGTWGLSVQSNPGDGHTSGQYARVTQYGDTALAAQNTLPTGPFHVALDDDFALGNNGVWSAHRYAHSNVSFSGGRLNIATTGNYRIFRTPLESPVVRDGQVDAIVRLRGAGRVGVTGRAGLNADGRYTLYACWFDDVGDVGLTRDVDGHAEALVMVQNDRVRPYEDNTIVMRIQGSKTSCYANGVRMLTYTDAHPLRPGVFGLYVAGFPDSPYAEGQYARILVAD